ncbi:MAG: flagellar hook-basal body complex protein FliE [Micavibrio sp.]|nr:MAG: flagellar hook-basal body complex protein FliE [Micavibrio sp.]
MTDIKAAARAYAEALAKAQQGLSAGGGMEKVATGPSFGEILQNTISGAVQAQRNSERVSAAAVAGKADITDVLQAVTEAEMSLNTVLAVRDRVIRAYEEVMRSPI